MNPLYFGTSERRIFGIYEPAAGQGNRAKAAVLCNPWGSEYVYAHRSLRQLAVKLASCGYHTFRFDFYGTGDSGGDLSEANLHGWEADTISAIEGVRDIAGSARVALIGLRLGANIAATVAARFPSQVDALVMWDPLVSGQEYVSGLRATSRPMGLPDDPDAFEVDGFVLTSSMMRGIEALDLRPLIATPPARSLVLFTEEPASNDGLAQLAESASAQSLAIEFLPAPCPWVESVTTTGAVPVRVVQRIAEWLG